MTLYPAGACPPSSDAAWYAKTGHCGKCGQPGTFCLCTDRDPCGCRGLHPMGSGREPDALTQFVEASPDQDGLF